jgi:hypothetical protein
MNSNGRAVVHGRCTCIWDGVAGHKTGGTVLHGEHGTWDAAGRSASTNYMGNAIHSGRDGLAGQFARAVGLQRLSAMREKRKRKASQFDLDNTLNDFD